MNKIERVDYTKQMKKSYIDYAMSVIISRALPDVRDGLKPVHRRILYDMYMLGLYPEKPYKKSARTVGDVLGKYHPHGDSSVYDALVRMAQDFSMRYMLVDGHGNFGTIDGDSSASMRYTESKLQKITMEMLRDINKNTVDFIPNFDGEELEPTLLTSRFPNLLVNGTSGIAVGVATNIPPHNLNNAIDTIIYQINNPTCQINELVDILKAPDFPTGGTIINPQDMNDIYSTGKGSIVIRGKYNIEIENKQTNIIFTEIPYGVNKSSLMDNLVLAKDSTVKKTKVGNKIVETTIDAKIPQIEEVYDASNRNGIKITIKLKKNTDVNVVLNLLFKYTKLQTTFGANFNAVYGDVLCEELSLKQINDFYIEHQKNVLYRRTQFDLNKANKRIHILEGLKIALLDIDKTINIIKSSKNKAEAKINLIDKLSLSEIQSLAILEIKLHRLTNLEIESIKEEYDNLNKLIKELENILNNQNELLKVLIKELSDIKENYGDDRRTDILYEDTLKEIDFKEVEISDYNCRIFYTNKYIKKHLKQSDNHKIVEGNTILGDFATTNKSTLLIFTNKERRYRVQCSDLEQYQPSAHGTFIPKLLGFEDNEEIIKIVSIEKPTGFILVAYQDGNLAKIKIDKYLSSYKKLEKCYSNKSKVLDIYYSEKDVDILILSDEGKGIIFNSSNFNAVGSTNSQGNVGMRLAEGGKVISAIIGVNKEFKFELETLKGKSKEFYLNDIAPTNKPNEERDLFTYLYSKRGNQGNFLINTRINNDSIISLK